MFQEQDFITRIPLSPTPPSSREEHRRHVKIILPIFLLLTAALVFLGYLNLRITPPPAFHNGTLVEVPQGATLDAIARILQDKSVIRSPLIFKLLIQHYGKEHAVLAGAYLFNTPLSVIDVARRIALGDHGVETLKVTLPEGLTAKEMSAILQAALPKFDAHAFTAETSGEEGYLFPDTYFFSGIATSGPVVRALEENFNKKTADVKNETLRNKKSWSDIIIMASILEEETATPDDRRIVSGILWNRISKGMRLQIDATFGYTIGKGSLELTMTDLKTDSPYNTYLHTGLPPTPIANPGLDAIDAALHPTASPYLYYLSDKSGLMHYAKTFEEHKKNKVKYLP